MHFTVILLAILSGVIRGTEHQLKDGPCTVHTKTDLVALPPHIMEFPTWYHLSTNSPNPKWRNRRCYKKDVSPFDGGFNLHGSYNDENNRRHYFLEKVYFMNETKGMTGQTSKDHPDELYFIGEVGRFYSFVAEQEGRLYLLHICKNYGNKHIDNFDIIGQKIVSKKTMEKLKKIARDEFGDDREFIDVDQCDCD